MINQFVWTSSHFVRHLLMTSLSSTLFSRVCISDRMLSSYHACVWSHIFISDPFLDSRHKSCLCPDFLHSICYSRRTFFFIPSAFISLWWMHDYVSYHTCMRSIMHWHASFPTCVLTQHVEWHRIVLCSVVFNIPFNSFFYSCLNWDWDKFNRLSWILLLLIVIIQRNLKK